MFLFQQTYSAMGGIQRFNRCMLSALEHNKLPTYAFSLYDDPSTLPHPTGTIQYLSAAGQSLWNTCWQVVQCSRKSKIIVLGHIHLAPIGLAIKLLFPSKKIWLIAHGIEVWESATLFQKMLFPLLHKVLAVSRYTQAKLHNLHKISLSKIEVFPNTIHPEFEYPTLFEKPDFLKIKHNISNEKIVLSVTRLSHTELYKGYDHVLKAIATLSARYPIRYILAGKYDQEEYLRIMALIAHYGIEDRVTLTGYVSENELTAYYLLADVFILPSKKEGFGIVFIEAMACGLRPIAGNQDGSVDALDNGRLGVLVSPDDPLEITKAIEHQLVYPMSTQDRLQVQSSVREKFGFPAFAQRVAQQFG